jgi:integrase
MIGRLSVAWTAPAVRIGLVNFDVYLVRKALSGAAVIMRMPSSLSLRFIPALKSCHLNNDELRRLWDALERHPNRRAASAVQLQVLTGARLGEVLSAKCSDFDLDRGVWRKPSHQTKRKRTEHVPLSGAAIKLLQDLTAGRNDLDAWLFPGRIEGQPLKEIKRFWASLTKMAGIEGYRLHESPRVCRRPST